jgi:hypothetical protein
VNKFKLKKNKMHITYLILILKIILSLSNTFIELNNDSFNELVEKNKYDKNKKLLVIFYTKNCYNCNEAIRIITNDILNEYRYDTKIQFAKVDCDLRENIWLNIRFNITRIPYIIIIRGNYFYELQSNYDTFELNYFINEQRDIKDISVIPKDISTIQKRIIIMRYTITYINKYFESRLNMTFNKNTIIFIFILFLILFLWILFYLIKLCCYALCGECLKCFGLICKRKNNDKTGIKVIKEVSYSKISKKIIDISENELGSKEDENDIDNDNGDDSLSLNDNSFNKEINSNDIKKKYFKAKSE